MAKIIIKGLGSSITISNPNGGLIAIRHYLCCPSLILIDDNYYPTERVIDDKEDFYKYFGIKQGEATATRYENEDAGNEDVDFSFTYKCADAEDYKIKIKYLYHEKLGPMYIMDSIVVNGRRLAKKDFQRPKGNKVTYKI